MESPGGHIDSDEGSLRSSAQDKGGVSAHLPHTWLGAQSSPQGGKQSRENMSCWSLCENHGSSSQQTQQEDREKAAMLSTVDQLTLSDRGHSSNKDFYSPWHISTTAWSCQRMFGRTLAVMELEMRLPRGCQIFSSWLDCAFSAPYVPVCPHHPGGDSSSFTAPFH